MGPSNQWFQQIKSLCQSHVKKVYNPNRNMHLEISFLQTLVCSIDILNPG